ncbi:putative WRKY transcription factor 49 [Iris pallida]|uniref:WRKY transcription factor 49 n=1 Tax=Iris pallida TaxID=29817 RepID=A0AAX6IIY8_IRIPA|nr:putative WRKY transcription factor 49 [Iris pallida]
MGTNTIIMCQHRCTCFLDNCSSSFSLYTYDVVTTDACKFICGLPWYVLTVNLYFLVAVYVNMIYIRDGACNFLTALVYSNSMMSIIP